MTDSAATDAVATEVQPDAGDGATTETAKAPPKPPRGYLPDGDSFRAATFDADRFGLGRLTFKEPTWGRFRAFQDAETNREALLLRAIVSRSTSNDVPKHDAPVEKWVAWFADLRIGTTRAVIDAASFFLRGLEAGIVAEGNE